jgi:hypothetical protein
VTLRQGPDYQELFCDGARHSISQHLLYGRIQRLRDAKKRSKTVGARSPSAVPYFVPPLRPVVLGDKRLARRRWIGVLPRQLFRQMGVL